jgi:hypothetical protein
LLVGKLIELYQDELARAEARRSTQPARSRLDNKGVAPARRAPRAGIERSIPAGEQDDDDPGPDA